MNERIFAAAAAASWLFAGMAHASPDPAVRAFLDEAHSQAQARIAGADLGGRPVKVRAYVDGAGRLVSVRVVSSAGSRDADHLVETAVKQVRVRDVPPGLIGAQVNLAFEPTASQLATAR